ncbi:MAG TPA: aldehyde dehydrogenase [Gaiellales bacterium]|nr:aldehyde dehydrogenase [Gaiellales bacterium]
MSTVAGVDVSPDHYIGGMRVPSAERFSDRSPIDGTLLAEVARGGQREVDLAVRSAAAAFPEWAALGAAGRAPYLHRLADLIDANVERLATVECLDMAMLERSLRARVIGRGARNYRSYADLAAGYEERVWESNGTRNRVIRMPPGPAAVITPWNAPFMLSTWKTAPALAAGCTVILKPAEWSPLSCSLLVDLAGEAGLPAGVFNVVQGIGEEAGAALVSHPGVRRVSFTGSPETGRLIGTAAAGNLVPFTAELGGKGPLIVFEDADVEAAAKKAAGQYDDAGQVCLAGTRLLVAESIRDDFLERFHRHTDAHVLGDPRADDTTVSPLIHPDHLARVEGFVERAREHGDRIVRGGRRAELGGLYYEPTLIEPRGNDSEVVQREVFGPVLTLQTFASEDEAVELANSTAYGLSAIVYTGSSERAERVGRSVRAGTVWVNTFLVRDLTAPFGGMGISGIGREGGDYALDFYSDLKTLQIVEGSTA